MGFLFNGRMKLPHTKLPKEAITMDHPDCITISPDRERGQHLTFEERCVIKVLHKQKKSLRFIADEINCSPSTVMYELRRGTTERKGNRGRKPEYSAKRGEAAYKTNRSRCHKAHIIASCTDFVDWVICKIKDHNWSLDACVGYAKKHKLFPDNHIPCTKTLYNELWAGNLPITASDLPEALSRNTADHKKTRKNKRLMGTSIDERPEEASKRTEVGHWEIDTVVGHRAGRESVVLSLIEKKTQNYLAIKIDGKDSTSVMSAMKLLYEEYGEQFSKVFKTITADNGTEFETLSATEEWGTKVYYSHPYSSWERPQNERHNRILRRYIPKGVSIEKYSAEQIMSFSDEMNTLPRKTLGYKTPEELFDEFLDSVYTLSSTAA